MLWKVNVFVSLNVSIVKLTLLREDLLMSFTLFKKKFFPNIQWVLLIHPYLGYSFGKFSHFKVYYLITSLFYLVNNFSFDMK